MVTVSNESIGQSKIKMSLEERDRRSSRPTDYYNPNADGRGDTLVQRDMANLFDVHRPSLKA